MKADRERRFADPVRTIMAAFTDGTDDEKLLMPINVGRMAAVMHWRVSKEEDQIIP